MSSLCVRRPPSAVRRAPCFGITHEPFSELISNCTWTCIMTKLRDFWGILVWIIFGPPRAPQMSPGGYFCTFCQISQKLFSNFFSFCTYSSFMVMPICHEEVEFLESLEGTPQGPPKLKKSVKTTERLIFHKLFILDVKLSWTTYRKLYMTFHLAPWPLTLDDLERSNQGQGN